jgi:hypothetical protein
MSIAFCISSEMDLHLAVIEPLEASAELMGGAIHLVVRPRHREEAEPYQARHSASIGVVVSKHGDVWECAMASDLVIGMTTMLLVEACYLGCRRSACNRTCNDPTCFRSCLGW